jgi:uncharacterized protein YqhQ
MRPLRRAVQLSLVLGGISILAVVVSYLALTDIGHGESDLSLEWGVLRAAFLVIVLFQVSALVTLGRVFQVLR